MEGRRTDCGKSVFAMELVRGMPINEYCDRKSSPAAALELFHLGLQAVQHANPKGDPSPRYERITL